MSRIVYKQVTGTQTSKPLEVDLTTSIGNVYLRKNIKQVIKDGESHWEYQEAILTTKEYEEYLSELESPILTTIMQTLTSMQLQIDELSGGED